MPRRSKPPQFGSLAPEGSIIDKDYSGVYSLATNLRPVFLVQEQLAMACSRADDFGGAGDPHHRTVYETNFESSPLSESKDLSCR